MVLLEGATDGDGQVSLASPLEIFERNGAFVLNSPIGGNRSRILTAMMVGSCDPFPRISTKKCKAICHEKAFTHRCKCLQGPSRISTKTQNKPKSKGLKRPPKQQPLEPPIQSRIPRDYSLLTVSCSLTSGSSESGSVRCPLGTSQSDLR